MNTAAIDKHSAKTICELITPSYNDVLQAAKLSEGFVHKTPVITSQTLNKELQEIINCEGKKLSDIQVYFKCENLQKTGSFKIRGGLNAVCQLSDEQKKVGVLAYSAGNHAQGIALSGQTLGIKTTIIMPKDAPQLKIDATRGYGANIIFFDRYNDDIDQIIEDTTKSTGMTFISPFDNFNVIAGQGTCGKEFFEEVGELDHLIMGIGGGGLISGCALAAKELSPNCKIWGVEPQGGDDARQSIEQNKIVSVNSQVSIADGASTPHIGEYTFIMMKKYLDGILQVSDDDLVECMKFFGERCKMIVEPTGCLGLSGLKQLIREGKIKDGDKIGCVLTGGNIDLLKYSDLIQKSAKKSQNNLKNLEKIEKLSLISASSSDESTVESIEQKNQQQIGHA